MKYGIIGDDLSHGFTEELHAKVSHNEFQSVVISEKNLAKFFKDRDFSGIIISSKYKEKVMKYLDVIDEHAKELGSVGVVVNRHGTLYGYNTDFEGICGLIVSSGITVRDKKVLILGNKALGKTAKAVCLSLGVETIYQVDDKGDMSTIPYEAYKDYVDADVIINCTFIGRYPNINVKPVDISKFANLKGVIDTVYNPLKTALTIDARSKGIPAVSGMFMLVRRTIIAEELFTGDKLKYSLNEQVLNELLREKENVVLIGMPGCGKTAVGAVVANKMSREFVDVNQVIEDKYGSPAYISRTKGEQYLRDIEKKIILELASKTGVVIATNASAVLDSSIVYSLKSNGKIIFIDRSVDLIDSSYSGSIYDTGTMSAMFVSRFPKYKKSADIIVDGDLSIKEVAESIIGKFKRGISSGMLRLIIINGPNVNLLGIRQPDIYGKESYTDLCERIHKYAESKGIKVEIYQSNHEGNLVDKIQESLGIYDGMIINASSYAHTSVAIPDAIAAIGIPCVNVHLSDIDNREEYRKNDYLKEVCTTNIVGSGTKGYFDAIDMLVTKFG